MHLDDSAAEEVVWSVWFVFGVTCPSISSHSVLECVAFCLCKKSCLIIILINYTCASIFRLMHKWLVLIYFIYYECTLKNVADTSSTVYSYSYPCQKRSPLFNSFVSSESNTDGRR